MLAPLDIDLRLAAFLGFGAWTLEQDPVATNAAIVASNNAIFTVQLPTGIATGRRTFKLIGHLWVLGVPPDEFQYFYQTSPIQTLDLPSLPLTKWKVALQNPEPILQLLTPEQPALTFVVKGVGDFNYLVNQASGSGVGGLFVDTLTGSQEQWQALLKWLAPQAPVSIVDQALDLVADTLVTKPTGDLY
jgi:hypothetical protein